MKKTELTTNPSGPHCAAILPLLSEFIDGALRSETAWTVQKHITLCPECAQRAREFQKTASLLAALPPRPLSHGFDGTLSARIAAASAARAEANKSPWRRLLSRLLPGQAFPASVISRPFAGAVTAFIACVGLLATFVLNQPLAPVATRPPAAISAGSDSALVAACLMQHHATVASEPLADPSAQMLDSQLDTDPASAAPPAAGQAQGLSDADAAALVNETD